MDKLKSLLVDKLGLTPEMYEKLKANDQTVNDTEVYASIESHQKRLLQENPSFMKEINDEVKLKERGMMERSLRRDLKLTGEEYKTLKFDELLSTGVEKLTKELLEANKDAVDSRFKTDAENAKQQAARLEAEVNRLTNEHIPTLLKEKDKVIERKLALMELERSVDQLKFINPAQKKFGFDSVVNELDRRGVYAVLEEGKLKFRTIAHGTEAKTPDGLKFLEVEPFIDGYLKQGGFIAQSNAGGGNPPPPNPPANPDGGGGGGKRPFGMDAAEQNLTIIGGQPPV